MTHTAPGTCGPTENAPEAQQPASTYSGVSVVPTFPLFLAWLGIFLCLAMIGGVYYEALTQSVVMVPSVDPLHIPKTDYRPTFR